MDLISVGMFAAALLIAAGSPGPSILALVSRVISSGWRDVLPFIAAMWVGELIWLCLAIAGLTKLAVSFQLGFQVLKWAGVGYLLWLAYKMWTQPTPKEVDALPQRKSGWKMFMAGMAVTLGNPKIMVFYIALLPSLIDMTAINLKATVVLCVVTLACLAFVDVVWISAAQQARRLIQTPAARRCANRISALTLGGAASLIAARA